MSDLNIGQGQGATAGRAETNAACPAVTPYLLIVC